MDYKSCSSDCLLSLNLTFQIHLSFEAMYRKLCLTDFLNLLKHLCFFKLLLGTLTEIKRINRNLNLLNFKTWQKINLKKNSFCWQFKLLTVWCIFRISIKISAKGNVTEEEEFFFLSFLFKFKFKSACHWVISVLPVNWFWSQNSKSEWSPFSLLAVLQWCAGLK